MGIKLRNVKTREFLSFTSAKADIFSALLRGLRKVFALAQATIASRNATVDFILICLSVFVPLGMRGIYKSDVLTLPFQELKRLLPSESKEAQPE